MPIHNNDIAKILNEVADLLDIKDENQFRVRSYRNAARTIDDLSGNITEMMDSGKDISGLPGIGKSMLEKIREIVKTGSLKQLKELKKEMPGELIELMKIKQLGPERIKALYDELGIRSLKDLKSAAKKGDIAKLEGFGEKTQENILKEIERFEKEGGEKRYKWKYADDIIRPLAKYLEDHENTDQVVPAGSYRRKKETVGDLDILVTGKKAETIMDHFTGYDEVNEIVAKGKKKTSVVLRSGIQVDLRAVAKSSYGAAMLYFTGSKAHNIKLRKMAIDKELKINEYGIFHKKDKKVAGKTEQEMYKKIGIKYIEPELREDRGEIEASQKSKLPGLVRLEDIRGDLHTHTNYTDGKKSLREMVEAAADRGYEYYAVSDHSKRVSVAGGLDQKGLARQIKEIDKLNKEIKNLRILKSIEVDILEDGSLDLPDDILKELDLVVCSVHYNINLPEKKQTERVIRAMDNPYFNIFAHPSGRLIGEREPYRIDLEKIMEAAKDRGCYLEINAYPDRLDLDDVHARTAKEMGLKLAISTDAHSIDNLNYIEYGVGQARRGWLGKDDILNTRPWNELKKLLKRK